MIPDKRVDGLLQRRDVRGLLALGALLHFETDLLVFLKGLEAVSLDFREMREQVFAAAVRCDEAKALCIIEPLHNTCCHFPELSKKFCAVVTFS